ncbi:DedA family protein [Thermodesulfovibrio yellowstonii]|uniref:DedA family protein n=1 Tax=Thermodesulfovibrio yellowstonii TaxID=28262 RepID=A0A9W6GEJ0_9BACT|nr:DedA family protein [Thermodesulfovibrio islandicus]GLI53858.1 DedA family protein [Thermodesulfovibrio islandicus]
MIELTGFIEHVPYLGLFLLLILGGVGLPFPEDTTLILCGFLISTNVVKPVPALLVVYSGLLMADLFLYFVGKKYGRMIVTHRRFHKILSPERLAWLESKFNKRGTLIIILGRHFIGLRAQIILVSGVMRMSLPKFIVADAISSTFTIALMAGAGYLGGNSLQHIKNDITKIEHIGIFMVVVGLTVYVIVRYFKSVYSRSL